MTAMRSSTAAWRVAPVCVLAAVALLLAQPAEGRDRPKSSARPSAAVELPSLPTRTAGTPLELPDPLQWQPTAPPLQARWPQASATTTFVIRRGDNCGPVYRIRFTPRRVRDCTAEQRWQGKVSSDGQVSFQQLPSISPKATQLPAELASQWRVCPYRTVAVMEGAGSPWVPYQDPQVGQCYLWRPLDQRAWQRIAEQVRGQTFDDLPPYVAASMRELAVRAAAIGIEIRVITAFGKPTIHSGKASKGKKKRGRHRGGRFTYLHSWGLAVDLTVGWRRPLFYPDRYYREGSDVWRIFRTLGGWAGEMGFVWLGATMRGELVHFEFHPSTWGTIDGDDLTKLLALYHEGGIHRTHRHWLYDPTLASPFAALRDDGWN